MKFLEKVICLFWIICLTALFILLGVFSCLPCGHMFGQSCIKKWLGRQGTSKVRTVLVCTVQHIHVLVLCYLFLFLISVLQCPQCKRKCRIKDIRLLYATKVIAIDEALQKVHF